MAIYIMCIHTAIGLKYENVYINGIISRCQKGINTAAGSNVKLAIYTAAYLKNKLTLYRAVKQKAKRQKKNKKTKKNKNKKQNKKKQQQQQQQKNNQKKTTNKQKQNDFIHSCHAKDKTKHNKMTLYTAVHPCQEQNTFSCNIETERDL